MPNRILHERICVSDTIAQLTADEERFFYRLIVQCDDYGRFDGRASVIRARCFALQLDEIDDDDVTRWLGVLQRVGLVVMYAVDGRSFLRVTTWERHQQTRAKRSKYPDPEDDSQESASNGYQTRSDVPVIRESFNENRYPVFDVATREPQAAAGADHGADAPPKPKRQTNKPRTDPPESFEPNEADYAAGAKAGLSRADVEARVPLMLDYHRKEAKTSADWHASLRTWLGNTSKYDRPARASPSSQTPVMTSNGTYIDPEYGEIRLGGEGIRT